MKYEAFMPLVYLVTVSIVAAVLNHFEVPDTTIGIIVGAGLMRVKIPKMNGRFGG